MKTLYVLQVTTRLDDLVVAVFDTEADLKQYAAAVPPDKVADELWEDVYGRDRAEPLGYVAVKVEGGIPVDIALFHDTESGVPFDPSAPLFGDS